MFPHTEPLFLHLHHIILFVGGVINFFQLESEEPSVSVRTVRCNNTHCHMSLLYLFGEQCLQFLFIKKPISIGVCIIKPDKKKALVIKYISMCWVKYGNRQFLVATVQFEKRLGVKIFGVQAISFLPHLFQLVLAPLQKKNKTSCFTNPHRRIWTGMVLLTG